MAVTLGTITGNAWAGGYPYNQTFSAVCDAAATALLVFVTDATGGESWVPTATWGAQSMTLLSSKVASTGTIWVFGLVAPATGTKTFTVSNANNYGDIGAATVVPLLGTDTANPFDASATLMGSNTNALSVVTANASELILACGFVHYNSGTPACTGDAAVTSIWSVTTNANHTQWGYSMPAATAGTWHETFTTTNYSTSTNATGFGMVAIKGGGSSGPVANTKTLADVVPLVEVFNRSTSKTPFAEAFSLAEFLAAGKVQLLALVDAFSALADSLGRSTSRRFSDGLALAESLKRSATRTWSDAYSLADTAVRRIMRPLSDSYAVSDLPVNRAASRGLVDSVPPVETLTKATSRSVNESFSLLDFFAAVKTKVLALVDSLSLVELLNRSTGRGLADGFSLSDTLTAVRNRVLALADSFGSFAESLVRSVTRTTSEAFSLADTLAFLKTKVLAFTDTISLAESLLRSTARTVGETFGLTESLTRARTAVLALLDTFSSYADTLARSTARSFADALSLADVVTAVRAKVLALAESFAVVDTLARATRRAVADGLGLADGLTRASARTLTESFSLSDAIAFARVRVLALLDSLAVVETLARATAKRVAESMTLGDAIAFTGAKLLALFDSFIAAETLARGTARSLTDVLSLTDALAAARLRALLLLEALGLTDSLNRATGKSLSDGASLSDRIARQTNRLLGDGLTLAEALGRGLRKGLVEILGLSESVASWFTPAANLVGQPAHRFVVELWQRFWPVETPLRLFPSSDTAPFFSAPVEAPVRRFAVALPPRLFTATENMITTDPKDPEASENFQLDWSSANDPIVTSTWEVPAGLTAVSTSNTTTQAIVRLSGGVAGSRYVVKNVVTLGSGQIKTQSLLVPVA